jgi:hypothetical protein
MPDRSVSNSRIPRLRRRAACREDADRDALIFLRLRAGVAISDIARAVHCSERTVRRVVARTLAKRERDASGGYAQLQIERLNDALMVATYQMADGDLKALDRVLKVIESQDRYHGFGLPGGPGPAALPKPSRATPALRAPRLALPTPPRRLPAPEEREENSRADKTPPATA